MSRCLPPVLKGGKVNSVNGLDVQPAILLKAFAEVFRGPPPLLLQRQEVGQIRWLRESMCTLIPERFFRRFNDGFPIAAGTEAAMLPRLGVIVLALKTTHGLKNASAVTHETENLFENHEPTTLAAALATVLGWGLKIAANSLSRLLIRNSPWLRLADSVSSQPRGKFWDTGPSVSWVRRSAGKQQYGSLQLQLHDPPAKVQW